jgi:hypothetical protein
VSFRARPSRFGVLVAVVGWLLLVVDELPVDDVGEPPFARPGNHTMTTRLAAAMAGAADALTTVLPGLQAAPAPPAVEQPMNQDERA